LSKSSSSTNLWIKYKYLDRFSHHNYIAGKRKARNPRKWVEDWRRFQSKRLEKSIWDELDPAKISYRSILVSAAGRGENSVQSAAKDKGPVPRGVGLVETQTAKIDLPPQGFHLESGAYLSELVVAYETYGVLSRNRDNAVYICHALTGDAHVAGYHDDDPRSVGWWDPMVGPGKGIDTDHYFVVCSNILGGCKGTTGPSSIDPATGRPYGSTFPKISVSDIVGVQRLLLKQLGIERLAAVVGGSVGGMQVLEWIIAYPEMVERAVCVASGASKSTQGLAFDVVSRNAIVSDPDWLGGEYYGTGRSPSRGLAQARKLGHITYLSQEMMAEKFGRDRIEKGSVFQVESYLEYKGQKFTERFDANSYVYLLEAMDNFDLVERFGSIDKALESVVAKVLIVALSSDWLFPPQRSIELANALVHKRKKVSYCLLNVPHGHDAFLVDMKQLSEVVRAFLPWIRKPDNGRDPGSETNYKQPEKENKLLRQEFETVLEMIHPRSRILDLGCGNGELLSLMADRLGCYGMGIDIDLKQVVEVIDHGSDIFQGDIDSGLSMIPDRSYDYAILSETLQLVHRPRFVLHEMLRVADVGVVIFPNFGKWPHRLQLGLRGRMPEGSRAIFNWYDSPDVHLFTLKDFISLCIEDDIRVLDMVCVPEGQLSKSLLRLGLCNLAADRVLVKIARANGQVGSVSCRCNNC